VEYLVSKWGSYFAPLPESVNYWRYRYWLHYAEGSLMSQLLVKLVADKLGVLALPIKTMIRQQLDLHLNFLEGEAGKSRWIAGDELTAADIMMSYPLEAAAERAGLGPSRPRTWRLLQQIRQRPAYVRALARGTSPRG
jgi:glutathione S-transferase